LSLRAQSTIKDSIRGVLILLETRFGIGDTTQVGNVSRRAEQLTLRATYVRDAIRGLLVVPNGKVRILSPIKQ
jgi:small-conductance mechanosensitive channel